MLNQDLSSLLPVKAQSFSDKTINAIDGRSLHAFLEIGKDFTTWMRNHIDALPPGCPSRLKSADSMNTAISRLFPNLG